MGYRSDNMKIFTMTLNILMSLCSSINVSKDHGFIHGTTLYDILYRFYYSG